MRVALMTYIPHDLIIRKIRSKMQRHRQFDCAEIGAEMSSVHTDLLYQKIPDLLGKVVKISCTHILYVICFVDRIKYHSDSSLTFFSTSSMTF